MSLSISFVWIIVYFGRSKRLRLPFILLIYHNYKLGVATYFSLITWFFKKTKKVQLSAGLFMCGNKTACFAAQNYAKWLRIENRAKGAFSAT